MKRESHLFVLSLLVLTAPAQAGVAFLLYGADHDGVLADRKSVV